MSENEMGIIIALIVAVTVCILAGLMTLCSFWNKDKMIIKYPCSECNDKCNCHIERYDCDRCD